MTSPILTEADSFLERLLDEPSLQAPRLSPDGNWIAWLWSGLGPTRQAWIGRCDGGLPPRPLIADLERDCDSLAWAEDGKSLIIGQSREGAERLSLLQVFPETNEQRRLTPEGGDYFLRGGALHRDNRRLVFSANRDPLTGAPGEAFLLQSLDIETDAVKILARPQRASAAWAALAPGGDYILYPRSDLHPAGQQLWLAHIDGGEDREIVNLGPDRKIEGAWSRDGQSILLVAEFADRRTLGLWRLADGGIEWLMERPQGDLACAFQPRLSPDIIVTTYREARGFNERLTPEGRLIPFALPAEGAYVPIGPDNKGDWILGHYSCRHSYRLLRLDREGREKALISRHPSRANLDPNELREAEDYRWRSRDGLPLQGWLYRARPPALGTILLIHGGPTYHDSEEFDAEIQYYVRCGFHVLQPNYRGSTGFSLAFEEAIKIEGWGGAEQRDIEDAARALIRDKIATPYRIGITGTSYGGYSAWWAITHSPPEWIAAAAPICGMTDLVIDYETTRPDLRPYSEAMMGGTPASAPDRYRERSPIHHVRNIKGRLLIIQGGNDPNVTPANVEAVRLALDKAGIPYDLLNFADEGHGIARPENRRRLYRRLAHFFARAFAP